MTAEINRAFHEAGHAIAAQHYGARNIRVLVPVDRTACCHVALPIAGEPLKDIERQVVVLLAAPVAELLSSGQAVPQDGDTLRQFLTAEQEPRPDGWTWAVAEIDSAYGAHTGGRWLFRSAAYLFQTTEEIVVSNWSTVARWAERLEIEREIIV